MLGHMCAKKIWIKQNRPFEPSWLALHVVSMMTLVMSMPMKRG